MSGIYMSVTKAKLKPGDNLHGEKEESFTNVLLEITASETDLVLEQFKTRLKGLNEEEASARIKQYGLNEIAREKPQSVLAHFISNLKNHLIILLTVLAIISYITGDLR